MDIGVAGIKVVELGEQHGRPVLLTYGFFNSPLGDYKQKLIDDPAGAGALLKKICEKAGTISKKCVTGLPISAVFSALVNVPTTDEKEMKPAVELQSAKLSPWPLADIILDWRVVPAEKTDGVRGTQVLVIGAQKNLIKQYVEVFKAAGLEITSLETEAFALMRSLIGDDKSPAMILDIGGERTNIVIVASGVPLMSRSVDVGGKVFTAELAKTLGIGAAPAEEFKLDAEKLEAIMPGDSVLAEMYKAVLRPALNEIQYALDLYSNQNGFGAPKIEKIILTGGSCLLPGLAAFLNNTFKIRAYVGDPWTRTVYSEDLRPLLDKLGPRFSVAIGLAMREIGKKQI